MKKVAETKTSWQQNKKYIKFTQGDKVIFSDTRDHWENAVCRLLKLDEEKAKSWVEKISETCLVLFREPFYNVGDKGKIAALIEGTKRFFNIKEADKVNKSILGGKGPCGHVSMLVYEENIHDNNKYGVVGCSECQHGWLIDLQSPLNRITNVVSYGYEYFEGDDTNLGYGNYLKQEDWRIEKARRHVTRIDGLLRYFGINLSKKVNLLDIGSGYGFFRKAADEKNWKHAGVELSKHAVNVCKERFSFETFNGTLEEFNRDNNERFDIITMWDFLEHVSNPIEILKIVNNLLSTNGICVVKTPNLYAIEREIFRKYYHSFKKEHLQYFSPPSLVSFLAQAALKPAFLTSESHLLSGFFNGNVQIFSVLLKGSDLFMMATKLI